MAAISWGQARPQMAWWCPWESARPAGPAWAQGTESRCLVPAHRGAGPSSAQVLQGGGLESPTKPKGRPKKNSIPTSEQLTEQERAKEAERPAEAPGEIIDRSRED